MARNITARLRCKQTKAQSWDHGTSGKVRELDFLGKGDVLVAKLTPASRAIQSLFDPELEYELIIRPIRPRRRRGST